MYSEWKKKNGLCIICGNNFADTKDHLPPKVILPKTLRDPKTEFFTFPVCIKCNRESSDQDFLLSIILSWGLNQDSYVKGKEPIGNDLLALHDQSVNHITNSTEAKRRRRLLKKYIIRKNSNYGIDISKVPVTKTITKIVKAIYWLHTKGDIIQNYNPGWWIYPNINTEAVSFIDNHIKASEVVIQLNDRFIAHFSLGKEEDGVGGLISCSLHFYTSKKLGKGLSWLIIAAPQNALLNGESLYSKALEHFGKPDIKPSN